MRNVFLVALLLCLSVGIACASSIPLVNPSFESPVVSGQYLAGVMPTGWIGLSVNSSDCLIETTARCASLNITDNPDGSQFVRFYDSTNDDSSFVYQNTGVQIQAGVTYTFSADMNYGISAFLLLGGSDTPTGVVDTTVWIDPNNTPADYPNLECQPGGTWVGDLQVWDHFSFSLTVPSGDPLVGKYLCPALRTAIGWMCYDNLTLTSDAPSISGTITLSDYKGDPALCPVRVELKQGETVKYTTEVRLATATSAPFTVHSVPAGTYDVVFSSGKWLRNKLANVVVGTSDITGLNVTLINGDVNGSNAITNDDLAVPIKSLDQKNN